jgi:hypothetical protein
MVHTRKILIWKPEGKKYLKHLVLDGRIKMLLLNDLYKIERKTV